jgi:3-oxoadipate enol-lactonase
MENMMPFIEANGIETYYEIAGDGTPLLLIAGNGMDHTTFREQLPSFSRHFRCITYDMRGVGRSGVPDGGYTTREMADDALALLAGLDIDAAHVAGYSLGGAIAQEMAIKAPGHVRTLSLYSSYSHVEPFLRRRYELLIKIVLEGTPELWAAFTAFTAFGEKYINAHDDEIEEEVARRIARRRGPDPPSEKGLLGHYGAILSHNALSRLAAISCPTWIAVGSADPVTPPAYSRLMNERIAGSRLRIFNDAPHRLLNFTAGFTAEALAFLLDHG